MKHIHYTLLAPPVLLASLLASCSSVQEERTEGLENRIDRQDDRIESRATRRAMRAEAEDQRYHDRYDRIMGRPGGGY